MTDNVSCIKSIADLIKYSNTDLVIGGYFDVLVIINKEIRRLEKLLSETSMERQDWLKTHEYHMRIKALKKLIGHPILLNDLVIHKYGLLHKATRH